MVVVSIIFRGVHSSESGYGEGSANHIAESVQKHLDQLDTDNHYYIRNNLLIHQLIPPGSDCIDSCSAMDTWTWRVFT
ncbi:hypothetical protein BV22DRAFT_1034267 [Leucogyrophana mollusca]|uniref:Uncharacterized protein n=1 Tax=Leucogyrophana mollusca TaxID=85980 RepID=A0ACB8BK99_9AGAM|nr:hypothetical protein BV22DRAFT_1034267 [Leucogyrophana mollusca]